MTCVKSGRCDELNRIARGVGLVTDRDLVVDDAGRLTGIVTLDDIVDYLASLLGGIAQVEVGS